MNARQAAGHIDEHFTSYGNPGDPIDARALAVLNTVIAYADIAVDAKTGADRLRALRRLRVALDGRESIGEEMAGEASG